MPGIGIRGAVSVPNTVTQGGLLNGLEAETTAYITGLTTSLSDGQVTKIDALVKAIKTGLGITALSDAFDVFKLYAGETAESAVRNLVKNAHHSTLVNAPLFTAFEGFTGNGTSNYIEENWNGRTQGVNYLLDSASYGVYFRTFQRGVDKVNGVYSTTADGGVGNRIVLGSASNIQVIVGINSANILIPDSNINGFYILSRTSQTGFNVYRNKVLTNCTPASTKIPDQSLTTLARRAADTTVGLFNTSQVAVSFVGKGLTDTQVNSITDAIESYMDSNNKGVIA